MLLTIVIPVYNSGMIIPLITKELTKILSERYISHELILVNDFSTDNTWSVIEELMAENGWIKGINLTENIGQFRATLKGTKIATGDFILHMDDDMEHPPKEVLKLFDTLYFNENLQIVFGMTDNKYRIKGQKGIPKLRNNLINFIWGKYPTDSFRIFRRELVFKESTFLVSYPMFEVYLKHHVHKSNVGYIQVDRNPRISGKSGYSFYKKAKLFVKFTPSFLFKNYNNIGV